MEKLSSKAKAYITGKIRLAWRYYSVAREDCLKQKVCISCKRRATKIYADHIDPVGSFVPEKNDYVKRMFCERSNLQPLCEECHHEKTQRERRKSK